MKKNYLFSSIITIVSALILYYLFLPPLNLTSPGFWIYLFVLVLIFFITSIPGNFQLRGSIIVIDKMPRLPKYFLIGSFGVIFIILIINFILSPIFNSKAYSKRITINEDSSFVEDVKPVNFNETPLLDKDSSMKLGDRVMGEMTELVSQFYVSDLYTQINYNSDIIRVTPLEYSGVIKYFTNRKDGVKGYITVNSVTGETKLKQLDKGMRYMPSAMFNENLSRKLRFSYPTEIFGDASFELDNDGNPYWIVPTIKYVGIGMREEINGIIILDPITGKSTKYGIDDIPNWVDHAYSADLIIEQVNDWGKYKKGFINSIFGQKNVVATTDGYNYLVMDDDVYLYTGITSVISDESNLGFILTNMRTKETTFYSVAGAEEFSAMASAEGQVQQMKYKSTFPLLINLNNKPTYLVSLKDNAGLVKMYGFVDVQNYQRVVVTDASEGITKAAQNYLKGSKDKIDESTMKSKSIIIDSITNAFIEEDTYYYIKDKDNKKYKVSLKVDSDNIPFFTKGTKIKISYLEEEDVIEIIKIEI